MHKMCFIWELFSGNCLDQRGKHNRKNSVNVSYKMLPLRPYMDFLNIQLFKKLYIWHEQAKLLQFLEHRFPSNFTLWLTKVHICMNFLRRLYLMIYIKKKKKNHKLNAKWVVQIKDGKFSGKFTIKNTVHNLSRFEECTS